MEGSTVTIAIVLVMAWLCSGSVGWFLAIRKMSQYRMLTGLDAAMFIPCVMFGPIAFANAVYFEPKKRAGRGDGL